MSREADRPHARRHAGASAMPHSRFAHVEQRDAVSGNLIGERRSPLDFFLPCASRCSGWFSLVVLVDATRYGVERRRPLAEARHPECCARPTVGEAAAHARGAARESPSAEVHADASAFPFGRGSR